jgi:pimeloyl-ACP methyl ester carboxylesterase
VPRLRRWARKIGRLLLELAVVVTIASLVYNAATAARIEPATELYSGPFVSVDGKLVAYRRWGRGGSPIVLVGGFVEPSQVWQAVGTRLGATHRVFALDLPPFGYSQRKGPYTLRSWITLVHDFDLRFGLRDPVIVGHSLGAAVAVGEALVHPDELGGIVLLDGDAIAAGGAPSWLPDLVVGPWFTSIYRIATGSDWIFRRALGGAYGPDHPRLTRSVLRSWEQPFRVEGTLAAFRSMARYGIQGYRLADLRRVRVRSLVVWGQHDAVDSVGAGRASARALGAPFRVLPGAGHLSMLGAPSRLAQVLARFAAG